VQADDLMTVLLGLRLAVVFESVLTTLRTYVFSHTTSRISAEVVVDNKDIGFVNVGRRHLLDVAGLKPGKGHGSAVTLIQRFTLAANGLEPLVAAQDARAPECVAIRLIRPEAGGVEAHSSVRAWLLHEGPFRRNACLRRQTRLLRL
jgi:hypothetical protein